MADFLLHKLRRIRGLLLTCITHSANVASYFYLENKI